MFWIRTKHQIRIVINILDVIRIGNMLDHFNFILHSKTSRLLTLEINRSYTNVFVTFDIERKLLVVTGPTLHVSALFPGDEVVMLKHHRWTIFFTHRSALKAWVLFVDWYDWIDYS